MGDVKLDRTTTSALYFTPCRGRMSGTTDLTANPANSRFSRYLEFANPQCDLLACRNDDDGSCGLGNDDDVEKILLACTNKLPLMPHNTSLKQIHISSYIQIIIKKK